MKFKPTIGTDLTGKLGGIVASHNTYGAYFRRLVKPVNPKSAGQQFQRNAFAAVTQAWRGLSDIDQDGWKTAATLNPHKARNGSTNVLTGHAYFMSVNTLRQRIGLEQVTAAPTSTAVPAVTDPAIACAADGTVSMTFDAGDEWNAAGGGVIVSVSALLSSGRKYTGTFYAFGTNSGAFAGAGITDETLAMPFNVANGGTLIFQVRAVTPDGRISSRQLYTVVVPAGITLVSASNVGAKLVNLVFSSPVADTDFTAANIKVEVGGTFVPATTLAQVDAVTISATAAGFAADNTGHVIEVIATSNPLVGVPEAVVIG